MTGHDVHHTAFAFMLGSSLPLQQVVYDPEGDRVEDGGFSWFSLVFADAPPPGDPEIDRVQPTCLYCVIDTYGSEVAVPLDLAKANRCSVVRDEETGEWLPDPDYFVGEDA